MICVRFPILAFPWFAMRVSAHVRKVTSAMASAASTPAAAKTGGEAGGDARASRDSGRGSLRKSMETTGPVIGLAAECMTRSSDINEHCPVLMLLASRCDSVLELGVRSGVSFQSALAGLAVRQEVMRSLGTSRPLRLTGVDVDDVRECPGVKATLRSAEAVGIPCEVVVKSDLEWDVEKEHGPVDMTFIDTLHIYGQLKRELALYAPVTTKYIVMHDTTVDGATSEAIRMRWDVHRLARDLGMTVHEVRTGLWLAVREFLADHATEWRLSKRYTNNNGLTILERIGDAPVATSDGDER